MIEFEDIQCFNYQLFGAHYGCTIFQLDELKLVLPHLKFTENGSHVPVHRM